MLEIVKGMDDPAYIVLQKNGRYAEVVRIYDKSAKAVWAVLDFGDFHHAPFMNGYEEGGFNVLVTTFEPDNLQRYMDNTVQKIVYDKTKDASGSGSSRKWPSHSTDTPFATDSIFEPGRDVKERLSLKTDSAGREQPQKQQEFFKDSEAVGARDTQAVQTDGPNKASIDTGIADGYNGATQQTMEEAYRGTGLTVDEVWVEVICDSLGDMNIGLGEFEVVGRLDPATQQAQINRILEGVQNGNDGQFGKIDWKSDGEHPRGGRGRNRRWSVVGDGGERTGVLRVVQEPEGRSDAIGLPQKSAPGFANRERFLIA